MIKSWELEFLDYAKTVWFDNCVERHDWGDDPHEFDDYVRLNNEWLKKEFVANKVKKMREREAWMP